MNLTPPVVALCEKPRGGEDKAQVTVYNTKYKRKTKTCTFAMAGNFTHAAFSKDSKYLATYGRIRAEGQADGEENAESPRPTTAEGTLVLWNWSKSNVMATSKVIGEVANLRYHPTDVTVISVSGPGLMRLYKIGADTGIKDQPLLLPKRESENRFAGHTWLRGADSMLVAVTVDGKLFAFRRMKTTRGGGEGEGGESGDEVGKKDADETLAEGDGKGSGAAAGGQFELVLETEVPYVEPTAESPVKIRIHSITASAKGFVVGGNHGFIAVYERTDDVQNPFMLVKCFQVRLVFSFYSIVEVRNPRRLVIAAWTRYVQVPRRLSYG